MKTKLLRMIAFTVVMVLMFGAAVVPVSAKAGTKSIVFIGVHFVPLKGYVFKFRVTGDLNKKDMLGSINIGNDHYSLNCRDTDSGDLACSPSDSLRRYSGRSAIGVVGGFSFTAVVPKPFVLSGPTCYSIFDYDPSDVWKKIGEYCSRSAPTTIEFYNPDWGQTYTYYHYSNGSSAVCQDPPPPNWGEGYYYDDPEFCAP